METKDIYINGEKTEYAINSDGTLFNKRSGKFLKGTLRRNEYLTYYLRHDGKQYNYMAHRLVAEYFIDNPNGYTIVHHKDKNKLNNNVENLEWVTSQENARKENQLAARKNAVDFSYEDSDSWTPIWDTTYQICREGYVANKNNKVLIGGMRNGYRRVKIQNKDYSIHRLVYSIFVEPITDKDEIDHIDGNKQNNNVNNLRKVSRSDNMKNAYKNGHAAQISVIAFDVDGNEIAHYNTIKSAADAIQVTPHALNVASLYGTKSGGYYWYRSDNVISKEQFISSLPDDVEFIEGKNKTYISPSTKLTYSRTSSHVLPQFSDNDGIYCYVCNDSGYNKFYLP